MSHTNELSFTMEEKLMGFLNGLLNCFATLANQSANRFDKMSDEEIDTKYGESADKMRNSMQAAHEFYDHVQNWNEKDDQ